MKYLKVIRCLADIKNNDIKYLETHEQRER